MEAAAGQDEPIDGRSGTGATAGQDEPIDGRSGTEAKAGQDELIDALVTASFATMGVLTRVAAEHDLSLTQLRVLAILRDRRVKMTELADYLGLDKSTVSGLVDRAERRGLLQRVPNPLDRRAVDVVLSAPGAELAEAGATQIARALSPMTSVLTPAEAHRLTSLLQRMLGPAGG
jgi:DNA-binding MarR family transcriptional regulator